MMVTYHPAVQREVNRILKHYDGISSRLADEFWDELMLRIAAAARHPEHFHFAEAALRRANLKQFPYHFLFRALPVKFALPLFDTTKGTLITPWSENSPSAFSPGQNQAGVFEVVE